ncbi:hypothetical protein ACO0LG_09090 [Undibacterium sp. Ji42W]|uniref:hypothetical protein n=1 Tax=Undibacterium sp. Ji42W TaxID=3413039 RepID=UPI003BF03A37
MNYPVKKLFSINGSKIEYDITFENAQDLSRYGMHEHAFLKKTNASWSGLTTVPGICSFMSNLVVTRPSSSI